MNWKNAVFAGKTETELPETRKVMGPKATYVDVYPFIWEKYEKHGYVTNFLEDSLDIGTFQYRLKGFKDQPTDIYTRPMYQARRKINLSPVCDGRNSANFVSSKKKKNSKPNVVLGSFEGE